MAWGKLILLLNSIMVQQERYKTERKKTADITLPTFNQCLLKKQTVQWFTALVHQCGAQKQRYFCLGVSP